MIQRRAKAAGIETRIGNHTFRATGITAHLKNSGKLEVAQQIANHESRARPSFMTGARMRFLSTRSNGLPSNEREKTLTYKRFPKSFHFNER
jgi:integrase